MSALTRLALNASMSCLLGCRLRNVALRAIGVGLRGDTKISRGTRLGGVDIRFGPGCGANEECWIDDGVVFGSRVRVGPRVAIYTKGHPRGGALQRRGDPDLLVPVQIGDGVWLRASCVIMPGVSIAPGCIIGVGAVVTRNTDLDGLYAGNPAVRIADLGADGSILRYLESGHGDR